VGQAELPASRRVKHAFGRQLFVFARPSVLADARTQNSKRINRLQRGSFPVER